MAPMAARNTNLIRDLEAIGRKVSNLDKDYEDEGRFSREYLKFISSPHWEVKRKRILYKLGGPEPECDVCSCCTGLQVHHKPERYPPKGSPIEAFIDQPEDRRNFSILCARHHGAVTQSDQSFRKAKRKK